MKRLLTASLSLLLIAGPATAEKDEIAQLTQESRGAIQAMGKNLKGELKAAMKAGGPVEAISVCNTKAPGIADNVSADKGVSIARRSVKNRNPENAPNDWELAVLKQFESRKAAGEDPAKMDHAEIVEGENGREFRYMKAIPTAKVCLNCHGAELKPQISQKLDELYPEDKARGYSVGDIRGAFRVIKSL